MKGNALACFELAFDPSVALRDLRKDRDLARLFRKVGPYSMDLWPSPSPFEALAESIVYQQLHARAASAIFSRLKGLFGKGALRPEGILAASDEDLRAAGLSKAKASYLRDLSKKAQEGLVPSWTQLSKLEDEVILERLTQVQGVGPWTVEMLLIFRLGRPDVWPVDDFAIRKAYGLLFEIEKPIPKEMKTRAEAWRPWRSVVARYLWRSLEV
jgi:3-methyladenine DNA glycosylase/8-oxoguanine DNA glycosylase